MRSSQILEKHRQDVLEISRRYESQGIHNLRVFGSVAKGLDTERSDVDFLVDVDQGVTLFTLGGLYYDLEQLLGVKIDLITSQSLPEAVKAEILRESRPI